MVISNVIVDVAISCRSVVFSQSCAKFYRFHQLVLDISSRRKVWNTYIVRLYLCSKRVIVSEVPLMYGIVAVVTGPLLTLV